MLGGARFPVADGGVRDRDPCDPGWRDNLHHSLGVPELREAIAEHYVRRYGVAVDPGRIIVSSGTSPLMFRGEPEGPDLLPGR